MWKVSRFTVVKGLGDHGLETHVLVFNTLSSQCVLLPVERWEAIVAGLERADERPEIALGTARLVRGGVLVDATVDERAAYEELFDQRRYNAPQLFPILAVTTTCNIGCTYCYEEGVTGEKATADVVAGVLRWMERRIVLDGVREIYPSLFGGEPLMYPKVLFALMDGLDELAEQHGVTYGFTSSSNGTLLTHDLAAELAAKGLQQIQISLDGPQHLHDERRIGKRGQPSFDKSLRGIRIAVEHIPDVTVKVNFDRHNRAGVRELYDFLIEEGLADRVDLKLETVAYQLGSGTVHDSAYVIAPESPELADAYLELMIEAQRRGLRVNRETAHVTPCMFSSHHGVIIGPDGSIYKCISLVGRKDLRVGTVFEDEYHAAEYAAQMDTAKRTEECWEEDCAYIPVCAGGCAYEAIVRTGRYDERFCTLDYLEEWHYKRLLVKFEEQAEAAGVRPLSLDELRASARTGLPQVDVGGGGCAGGCGTSVEQPLLQIAPIRGGSR